MRMLVRSALVPVLLGVALTGCQKGSGLRPSGWSDSGAKTGVAPAGTSAAPAGEADLLQRQAARLEERLKGENLEDLTRDWPRATELPGRPDAWKRVTLPMPTGAAPDTIRYAAMVDRGDPYVYWIEVSSAARGVIEYRGPSRLE